jgi:hypothetical protein
LEDLVVDGRIMYLRETVWEVIDWIHLAQDVDQMGSCKKGNECMASIKAGNFLTQ